MDGETGDDDEERKNVMKKRLKLYLYGIGTSETDMFFCFIICILNLEDGVPPVYEFTPKIPPRNPLGPF